MTNTAMTINRSRQKSPAPERLAYHAALSISALAVLYLLTALISGRAWLPFIDIAATPAELALPLIQCALGIAALQIPALLKRTAKIDLPDSLCILFYAFVLCGTVFGEMFSLYYAVPMWDDILHLASGIMSAMLGAIVSVTFLQRKKCTALITPVVIAVAALCFAVCIGTFWEIYEFAGDSLLGLNMQKCLLRDGSALIGKAALADTMKDLIVDTVGAALTATSAFVSLKMKRGWLRSHVEGKSAAQERGVISNREVISPSA